MSGGFFEYKQYTIDEIADNIEHEIQKGEYKHSEIILKEMDDLVYDLRKMSSRLYDLDMYLSADTDEDYLEKKILERRKI